MNHSVNETPSAVIIIPVHKAHLTAYERISFAQCLSVLHRHPIILIHPREMRIDEYVAMGSNFECRALSSNWFSNLEQYNRLKCSSYFYQIFAEYEFLLTYELDSFVFSDQLTTWCKKNYDFIGAPWFEGFYETTTQSPIIGVGNSGFSLRNVKKCCDVIVRVEEIQSRLKAFGWEFRGTSIPQRLARKILKPFNWSTLFKLAEYADNTPEDTFWGNMVEYAFDSFRVAPAEEAMHFSFEANPRVLFEKCDSRLPFGTHAWNKVDPSFWRPWIETFGYKFPDF